MKKKLVAILFVIIVIGVITIKYLKEEKISKNFFYMDTYINIKLYTNKNKSEKLLKEVEKMYQKYNNYCDKYNQYEDIINVYYLNEILPNNKEIELNSELSEIIKYSLEYYDKTNGKFNIAIANVSDIWKKYMKEKVKVPTKQELLNSGSINIKDITLKNNTYMKNNSVKIDLGGICKGYATEKVGEFLETEKVYKYLINAGGNVKVGQKYKNDKYIIGIQDPLNNSSIFTKIKVENNSVVTSGYYQRYYEVNGVRYHHIIDPDTLFPSNNSKSVTVISNNSAYADIMSTYLFLLDKESALKIVNNDPNLEAIIYASENDILKSNGIKQYE